MKHGKKLNDGDRMFDYMNKGGKLRGYKIMEEGGATDPPKKPGYSFVQQAVIDGSLPTDEASLKKLIETASIEKRQATKAGDLTGTLMFTADGQPGADIRGNINITRKDQATAASYYEGLISRATEKLDSIAKPELLKEGEFGKVMSKELEKGRSVEDINKTLEGERGFRFGG